MTSAPSTRNFSFGANKQTAAFEIILLGHVGQCFIHVHIRVQFVRSVGNYTAIHPIQFQFTTIFQFEFIPKLTRWRNALRVVGLLEYSRIDCGCVADHFSGVAELKKLKCRANDMTSHITQSSSAKPPPATPVKWNEIIDVVGGLCCTQPEIPL